jgi:hypothetical protein
VHKAYHFQLRETEKEKILKQTTGRGQNKQTSPQPWQKKENDYLRLFSTIQARRSPSTVFKALKTNLTNSNVCI